MGKAKDIFIKPINARTANEFTKKAHYSGKVVPNSQLHFGVFMNDILGGTLQFGPSMKKSGIISLVESTGWNQFLELNRMAFTDILPRFSESRAISIAMRIIKKNYPQIKWVISFSDGSQCGDGTIYRASGFVLTQIKKNTQIRINPITGKPMQSMAAFHAGKTKDFKTWQQIEGFQLRYIYFIDKSYKERLTVPILPFSEIDKMGAGMYKGEKISIQDRRVKQANSENPSESGGAEPTHTLQQNKEIKDGRT